MKKIILLVLSIIAFQGCKEEKKDPTERLERNINFNLLLNNYAEEGLKLYPLNATSQGDARYNDILTNNLKNILVELHIYYLKLMNISIKVIININLN